MTNIVCSILAPLLFNFAGKGDLKQHDLRIKISQKPIFYIHKNFTFFNSN